MRAASTKRDNTMGTREGRGDVARLISPHMLGGLRFVASCQGVIPQNQQILATTELRNFLFFQCTADLQVTSHEHLTGTQHAPQEHLSINDCINEGNVG